MQRPVRVPLEEKLPAARSIPVATVSDVGANDLKAASDQRDYWRRSWQNAQRRTPHEVPLRANAEVQMPRSAA
jgi:hypothetical protein